MATIDVISLASSPARASYVDAFDVPMSSSPLPSPSNLGGNLSRLRNGSRTAPIPKNATLSFATVAQLQKVSANTGKTGEEGFDTIRKSKLPWVNNTVDEMDSVDDVKPKVPRKSKTKKDTEIPQATEKKPRKSRAKKVEAEIKDDSEVKGKPARKPRAKKTDIEKQSKIPKGKVTKSTTASTSEKKSRKTTNTKVSETATVDEVIDVSAPLQLEEASRRRRDWTPVEETSMNTIAKPVNAEISATDIDSTSGKLNRFTSLLGTFAYADKETDAPKPVASAVGIRKRKLIELVKTGETSKDVQPIEKVKAVRKKARTITDLATSAYAVDNEQEIPEKEAPLLQYFPLENGGQLEKSKSRSRSPAKKCTRSTKGKNSVPVPVLLSPKSALKQLDKQDFVFGTSSQLAREDSPTLLRDLHQAMIESNKVDDPFAEWRDGPSNTKPHGLGRRTSSYEGKRGLWKASSRGLNDDLMEVEVVDLSESPITLKTTTEQDELPAASSPKLPELKKDDVWHDVDELCQSPVVDKATLGDESHTNNPVLPLPDKHSEWLDIDEMDLTPSHPSNATSKSIGPVEAAIRHRLQSSPPKPQKQTVNSPAPASSKQKTKPKAASKKSTRTTTTPDFSVYTTVNLNREIASYGFKPVKSRDKMILLLERCWLGKQQLLNPDASLPPPSAQPPASPKNSRRKAIESDSESETPLSQVPRKRKGQAPEAKSTSGRSRSRSASPRAKKAAPEKVRGSLPSLELQRAIMQAVTTAPRNNSGVNPSWHEKILLYDPIVIEEFTEWLNGGALEDVGWEGEIAGKDAKAWCEARSICCLWKENLRNGRSVKKY